jgi:hypothetical protein
VHDAVIVLTKGISFTNALHMLPRESVRNIAIPAIINDDQDIIDIVCEIKTRGTLVGSGIKRVELAATPAIRLLHGTKKNLALLL